jgi:hypothetical protein
MAPGAFGTQTPLPPQVTVQTATVIEFSTPLMAPLEVSATLTHEVVMAGKRTPLLNVWTPLSAAVNV